MNVAIIVGVVVLAFVVFIALRPGRFRLARSTTIQAPADPVFRLVNDFHEWPAWSPWEKLDPHMQRTYEGANSGRNAGYRWEGNNKVGAGHMHIVESVPPERVAIRLQFFRPMRANNLTTFTFVAKSLEVTDVTWAMEGKNGFVAKIFTLFMDMEKLVGKDFERGLDQLKATAEAKR